MTRSYFSYEVMEEIQPVGADQAVVFYKRTPLQPVRIRRGSEKDVREILGLGAAALASALPSRTWPAVARFTAMLRYRRKRAKGYAAYAEAMRAVLGIDDGSRCEALFREYLEMAARRRMMFTIDEFARRRNPPVEVHGAEALQTALDRGRGAIIWTSPFTFQTLAGKRALFEQGFRPIQISDTHHGFSATSFGNVAINPALRRAEDRYLKERIVFDRASGAMVTRKIVTLLDQGELILLTNNLHAGTMFAEMRFGERGWVRMPTAPLSIVARRATPFFSMATLETAPFGTLEAAIEPIDAAGSEGREGRAAKRDYARMAELALTARDNLYGHFRRAPAQYLIPDGLGQSRFERP
jgi:hypothetical protein